MLAVAWGKGQSGNPLGRRAGTRDRLADAYVRDLEIAWREHGPKVINAAIAQNPAAFLTAVGKLIPNESQHQHTVSGSIAHEHRVLPDTIAWVVEVTDTDARGSHQESVPDRPLLPPEVHH